MEAARLAWLRLAAVLGGPEALLAAGDAELRAVRLSPAAIRRLRRAPSVAAGRAALDRAASLGLRVAVPGDDAYPDRLLSIPDPPLLLYWRGRPPSQCSPAVAMVGAREPSPYGLRVTRELAAAAAGAGAVVISGLARGIDQAAHEGALATGRTAAVLPGGLDRIYPAGHRSLARRIVADGWLLGERPPGTRPRRHDFPRRNRLVTGLADLVVVVEAIRASGTWTSAMHALAQGREVLAVPGEITRRQAEAPNLLIADGCPPLLAAEEILGRLKLSGPARAGSAEPGEGSPSPRSKEDNLSPEERALLRLLDHEPRTVEVLSRLASLDGARVMALLTSLELAGLATASHAGGYVASGGVAQLIENASFRSRSPGRS